MTTIDYTPSSLAPAEPLADRDPASWQPVASPEPSILDDPQYPQDWSDYIGQEKAKRQLRLAAASAKARGVSMPHVLLACGIGGVGKTALAGLVAREMGTQVKVITGQTSVDKMRKLLTSMNDGDVIFYDEIHQAASGGRARAEWLLHYLQDGILLGPLGPMEVPAVTIVGATTEVGKLQPTIVSRFLVPPLAGYQLWEAALIAERMAPGVFLTCGLPLPGRELFVAVANAANCNPRAMRQILCTARDIAIVDGHNASIPYDLAATLDMLEITEDGLNLTMRRYLTVLNDAFDGAAGASTVASIMNEPGGLAEVERVLQQKGLIALTPRGRLLTDAGVRRAHVIRQSLSTSNAARLRNDPQRPERS